MKRYARALAWLPAAMLIAVAALLATTRGQQGQTFIQYGFESRDPIWVRGNSDANPNSDAQPKAVCQSPLVDCNGRMLSRPKARRPAFQAAGANPPHETHGFRRDPGKARVARGGTHPEMRDEPRRAPQRGLQRPQVARPSGAPDAQYSAVTVH